MAPEERFSVRFAPLSFSICRWQMLAVELRALPREFKPAPTNKKTLHKGGFFDWLGEKDECLNIFTLNVNVVYIPDLKQFKALLNSNSSRLKISSNGIETFIFRQPPKKVRTQKKGLTHSRRLKYKPHLLKRAKEFRKLMDKNHWTRAELARQLKVSRAWVSTVLNHDQRSSK